MLQFVQKLSLNQLIYFKYQYFLASFNWIIKFYQAEHKTFKKENYIVIEVTKNYVKIGLKQC